MNTINFLPASYLRKQSKRRRRVRQFALSAAMVGVLVGWWLTQQGRVVVLDRYATQLEVEAAAAVEHRGELVRLREEYKLLMNQVKVRRELAQPLNHTQIIAVLGEVMPATVMVTELDMTTHRPPPRKVEDATKASRKSKRKSAKDEPVIDEIRLRFDALAPDDLAVAEVVAAISEHPLFESVRMESSREVERYGVIGRKFRLSAVVPLNRVFLEPAVGQEVAHVDH